MSGEGHSNNRTARAKLGLVSHDNTGGYFIVECQGCGIVYPSFQCGGGDAIADTGDYNDAICPHCSQESPEECSNVGLVWNTQQLKINELQQRLTAADEQIDLLSPRHTEQPEGKRERFEKWVMATKHPVYGFLDGRSLARGDDRTGYADEYVQGLWVAYLAFGAEQPAPVAVVPDGYCIMPRQLTAENGAKAMLLGEFKLLATMECPECCELDEPTEGCSICDGEGEYGQKHTIPWDQIKFIYSKAVAGLALKAESAKSR